MAELKHLTWLNALPWHGAIRLMVMNTLPWQLSEDTSYWAREDWGCRQYGRMDRLEVAIDGDPQSMP